MGDNIVFLGGSYFSERSLREKISDYAVRIENMIKECGYEPSYNLLGNKKIFEGTDVKPNDVKFSDGNYFLDIGGKIVEINKKKIERVRGLRHFNNENELILCQMACGIIMKELRRSVAGIFELSAKSQGSFFEIGLLLYHYQVPVLALSHEGFGRGFATVITGLTTILLKTVKYNDDNIEDIVKEFLKKDLEMKKNKPFTYLAPVWLQRKITEEAKKKGFKNTSEFIRDTFEKLLEDN